MGYFSTAQRATLEAAMARVIPTTDTPGAREARTIEFLDRYLSGLKFVMAKPDGSGFEELTGQAADAWQQRLDDARMKYDQGIIELDEHSRRRFGMKFVELESLQQDVVLAALEQGADPETAVAPEPAGPDEDPPLQQVHNEMDLEFFDLLCIHTRQGFYADPVYGGNRDHCGWNHIGFPGPASLKDVHSGEYSTIDWFVDLLGYPGTTEEQPA